jgi:hypothetical protein
VVDPHLDVLGQALYDVARDPWPGGDQRVRHPIGQDVRGVRTVSWEHHGDDRDSMQASEEGHFPRHVADEKLGLAVLNPG